MLIAIKGLKGSGKDTFAEALEGFTVVKFAGPLKNMLRSLFRDAGVDEETIERMIEGDLKETPAGVLGGATPRWAMQSLGSEWRKMIDPVLWNHIFYPRVRDLLADGVPVVCTDLRFQHEAEVVRSLGGHIVHVERRGIVNNDLHESEQEMLSITPDTIVTNSGTVEDLHNKARTYLQRIMNQ